MIERWFNQLFHLSKRNYSDSFASEPFIPFGTIKGMLQPITGRLAAKSGKEVGEASYMLYTPVDSDISVGDRITDSDGRVFIAQFIQPEGISGVRDHQEVTLELET